MRETEIGRGAGMGGCEVGQGSGTTGGKGLLSERSDTMAGMNGRMVERSAILM